MISGSSVYISIASLADADIVDPAKYKVRRKIKCSSLIPLKLIKEEAATSTSTVADVKKAAVSSAANNKKNV